MNCVNAPTVRSLSSHRVRTRVKKGDKEENSAGNVAEVCFTALCEDEKKEVVMVVGDGRRQN